MTSAPTEKKEKKFSNATKRGGDKARQPCSGVQKEGHAKGGEEKKGW
jgi:hypothetical protein